MLVLVASNTICDNSDSAYFTSGEKLLLMLTKPDFHMKFYAWDAAHRKSDKL